MIDNVLALMCGIDVPVPECQLILHQPTIKEIAWIGEEDFFDGVQTLCIEKKSFGVMGNSPLEDVNNFQIFMIMMKENVEKKGNVKKLFQLILPNLKVNFLPMSLAVMGKELEQPITIDENNFEFLQQVLKSMFCLDSKKAQEQTFNPANERARQIAEKLMRGRERVAAIKKKEQGSIFSQYISTLTVGLSSMSLEDCMNLTMFQLFDLMERYSMYVSWDIDIRSRLAGAKGDKDPENWMKNIH